MDSREDMQSDLWTSPRCMQRDSATQATASTPDGRSAAYTGHPGDLVMPLDLANFPVDAETTWGIADYQDLNWYRLELLDCSLTALSFAAVQVTNYNLTYVNPAGLVADYNVTLNTTTGAIRDNFIHDAVPAGSYRHSGLALFTNLPLNTRYIRLLSNSAAAQVTEGIQIYLGGSAVPEPATAWLVGMGVLGVALARRR